LAHRLFPTTTPSTCDSAVDWCAMPFVTIMVAHNVGLTVTTSGTRGRIALPEHHTAGLPRIGKDMLDLVLTRLLYTVPISVLNEYSFAIRAFRTIAELSSHLVQFHSICGIDVRATTNTIHHLKFTITRARPAINAAWTAVNIGLFSLGVGPAGCVDLPVSRNRTNRIYSRLAFPTLLSNSHRSFLRTNTRYATAGAYTGSHMAACSE